MQAGSRKSNKKPRKFQYPVSPNLYGFDFEVEGDQREHKTLQILQPHGKQDENL